MSGDAFSAQGDVALRLMRDQSSDYQLMARWLSDERVLAFYEGRDNPFPLERIVEKYSPRVLGAERVVPCFILYRAQPIGYMQYYPVGETDLHEYGLPAQAHTFGIDLFIGEPEFWNRGIGTQALRLLVAFLFDQRSADLVVIDPETWNTRAIRSYEKCGFRKLRILPRHELHEGECRDSWLMAISRAEFTHERPTAQRLGGN
jgi:aminoglycoside 6'-N-acetyltransferase